MVRRMGAALFLLTCALPPSTARAQTQTYPSDPAVTNRYLEIGPVVGLTTAWHRAPRRAAAPLGAVLSFRAAGAGTPVRFTGVDAVERSGGRPLARVELNVPGPRTVAVELTTPAGEQVTEAMEIDVLPIGVDEVRFGEPRLSAEPFELDDGGSNEPVLRSLLGSDSIAELRELGEGRFRTSVARWVDLAVDVEPPGLAPLVEWRVDGVAQRPLGAALRLRIFPAGVHRIAAGPPTASPLELETYRVSIVEPAGPVREAVPVTFRAVTDPPGHEAEITWLAGTKHGVATPQTGRGPELTVRFDGTFRDRDPNTGDFSQWLGVRADNDAFGQDRRSRDPDDRSLDLDPDFGFDPASEFPDRLPPAPPSDAPVCVPGLEAVLADVDLDGEPEIVKLVPRSPAPGQCVDEVAYCVERDGLFRRVGGPVLSPDLPVPLAAISDGCEGVPAAVACPTLSAGEPALFCEGIAPDPACRTITLCPDAGAWPDPNDPTVRDVFLARDADTPSPDLLIPPSAQLRAAELVVISPCEWSEILARAKCPAPPERAGKANGERCAADDDCRSGQCEEGFCGAELFTNVFRGSDRWNVHLSGGFQDLKATCDGFLYPSLRFDLDTAASAGLAVTLFGYELDVLGLSSRNRVTECAWTAESSTEIFGVAIDIPGKLSIGSEDVFVTIETKRVDEGTLDAVEARCTSLLDELRGLERAANEALHDALVAAYFWNEAGGVGVKITGRDAAEAYVRAYEDAVAAYLAKLAELRGAQREATDHFLKVRLADLGLVVAATVPRELTRIGVGPFTLGLEASVVGKLGVAADVISASASDPAGNLEVRAGASIGPRASIGPHVFFYLPVGPFKAGIRGELDFAAFQLPVSGELNLRRGIEPLDPPALPPQFSSQVVGFLVQPSATTVELPFSYGAKLEGSFLSGRINAVLKTKIGFIGHEFKETLVSWPGIQRSWRLGLPSDQFDLKPIEGMSALGSLPDMVLLPQLALAAASKGRSPAVVQAELTFFLGLGHREADLGRRWLDTPGTIFTPGKCSTP